MKEKKIIAVVGATGAQGGGQSGPVITGQVSATTAPIQSTAPAAKKA